MTPQAERDLRIGWTVQSLGAVLLAVTIVSLPVLRLSQLEGAAALLAMVGPPPLLILGAFLLYRGKQLAARGRAAVRSDDPRPPVVYLRPFRDDEGMAGQVLTALLTAKVMSGFATTEEQLAEATAPIGPLVAIGRPGEALPKPGATRVYADDLEWKRVVDNWLAKARLVILRPGSTEGVRWETGRAFATVSPDRVLLFVKTGRRAYDGISESLRTKLGIVLPKFEEVRKWRRASGFFEFSSGWKPQFLRLKAPYWRTSPYKWMRKAFHYTLRPVFQRLQVDWHPLRLSVLRVGTLGLVGLIALLFISVVIVALVREATRDRSDGGYGRSLPMTEVVVPAAPARTTGRVAGLIVDGAGAFRLRAADVPETIAPFVEGFEVYQGKADGGSVVIVSRSAYKPGVQVSLEGAVQGLVNGVAKEVGLRNPHYTSAATRVSGHRALRTSSEFVVDNDAVWYDLITFARGPILWQVQVVSGSAVAAEDARQVLESVTIAD